MNPSHRCESYDDCLTDARIEMLADKILSELEPGALSVLRDYNYREQHDQFRPDYSRVWRAFQTSETYKGLHLLFNSLQLIKIEMAALKKAGMPHA